MKRKTIAALLLTLCLFVGALPLRSADVVIGRVAATDITASINGYPIPSYNVGGYLVVLVSDLKNYGMTTWYDNNTRTSHVTLSDRDNNDFLPYYDTMGAVGKPVYQTDIQVKLDGKTVQGYNIEGRMAVRFGDLQVFGEYLYSNDRRASSLTLMEDGRPFGQAPVTTLEELGRFPGEWAQKKLCEVVIDYDMPCGDGYAWRIRGDGKGKLEWETEYSLKPNTVYKVTVDCLTEDVGEQIYGESGAYMDVLALTKEEMNSVEYSTSRCFLDRESTATWQQLGVPVYSEASGKVKVVLNLGDYWVPSAGTVWYANLQIEEQNDYRPEDYRFDRSEWADSSHMRTSMSEDEYLDLTLTGDTLHLSGKIVRDKLERIWITGFGEDIFIDTASGRFFEKSIPLTGATNFSIWTKTNYEEHYWGYMNDMELLYKNGRYAFPEPQWLKGNLDILEAWTDPDLHLSFAHEPELKRLSDSIVGKETDPYRQILLLSDWVSANIHYDYDALAGRTPYYTSPLEVLELRRSVCQGYCELTRALVQAQGIPCMLQGLGNMEHVMIRAWADDRWVLIDPTWNSQHRYEHGKYEKRYSHRYYLDITPSQLSYSHQMTAE